MKNVLCGLFINVHLLKFLLFDQAIDNYSSSKRDFSSNGYKWLWIWSWWWINVGSRAQSVVTTFFNVDKWSGFQLSHLRSLSTWLRDVNLSYDKRLMIFSSLFAKLLYIRYLTFAMFWLKNHTILICKLGHSRGAGRYGKLVVLL